MRDYVLIILLFGFTASTAKRTKRSLEETTLIVCEGGEFVAQCPDGTSVNITSADYGRISTENICAKVGLEGNELCRSDRALGLAHAHCKAKNSCKMEVNDVSLGRPKTDSGGWCFDVSIYVRVSYTCLIDCQPPRFNYDVEVIGSEHSVGSTVTVYCRLGYRQADGQRDGIAKTCMADGTWVGPDLFCKDVDECANPSTRRCHMFAVCKNTRGSYSCTCSNGYHGDGKTCTSDTWFSDTELIDAEASDESDWQNADTETHDESICGPAVIRQRHGVLTSPRHPSNYPSNAKCVWFVMVPPYYVIELRFMKFELENQQRNEGCSRDNVTIYDYLNRDPRWWRGTFCSSTAPATMMSQTSKIRIEFQSDHAAEYSGFEIRFTAINLNFACLNFPSPFHDGILILNGGRNGTTQPRKSLTLACKRGYQSSAQTVTRTCQPDGTWDDFSNPCEPISCGPPHIPADSEGLIIRAEEARFRYNEKPVRYECEVDYKMQLREGYDDTILCDVTGKWSNEEHKITPRCEKITCFCRSVESCALIDGGPHKALSWLVKDHEGHVIDNPVGQQFTFGSRIEYSCGVGYVVIGDEYRLCTGPGWSGRRTSCEEVTALGLTKENIAIIASASSAFVILAVALTITIFCCRDWLKKRENSHERRLRAKTDLAEAADGRQTGGIQKYRLRPYLLPGHQVKPRSSQPPPQRVKRPSSRAKQESSHERRNSLSRIARPPPGYREPPPSYDVTVRQ